MKLSPFWTKNKQKTKTKSKNKTKQNNFSRVSVLWNMKKKITQLSIQEISINHLMIWVFVCLFVFLWFDSMKLMLMSTTPARMFLQRLNCLDSLVMVCHCVTIYECDIQNSSINPHNIQYIFLYFEYNLNQKY